MLCCAAFAVTFWRLCRYTFILILFVAIYNNFTPTNNMKNLLFCAALLCSWLMGAWAGFAQTEPQLNCQFLGKLAYPQGLSNLWSYVAPDGTEYAVVGTRTGTAFVDVSIPTAPVEVAFVPGPQSTWREVRTYQNHAYVVTEAEAGVTIIDMSNLPNSVSSTVWNGNNGVSFSTEHTVFVDEPAGYLYVFGANHGAGGAIIADLNQDLVNPPVVGIFDERYIHDGYVRNDTLWASEINDGLLEVINVTNKANPVVMASFATPTNFTHNSALTANGKTLFTTDEVFGAYIAAYDVSDLSDIKLLDVTQSQREGQADLPSPHNVYTMPDNFIVTSYYTDGVTIHDATHPDNMILVGYFDSSPLSDAQFEGDWGVAPYLPSGNLLLSDMQEGLFIVRPNYIHACYLFGNVSNASNGAAVANATVSIVGTTAADLTDFSGNYGTGTIDAGYYSIVASAPGYITDTIDNVLLANGADVFQNISLTPLPTYVQTGTVTDPQGFGIPDAIVRFSSADGTLRQATTDLFGAYTLTSMYAGTYEVVAGKWDYKTRLVDAAMPVVLDNAPINITLYNGYYDPFALDLGWTTAGNTPTGGAWDYGMPMGTSFGPFEIHPYTDSPNDFDANCYSTGNSGDVFDFVNGGSVTLTSPSMNLVTYVEPYLSFDAYFRNINQNFGPTNDTLIVRLSNGAQTVVIDKIRLALADPWTHKSYSLQGIGIALNNTVTVSFEAKADASNSEALEVAIDNFALVDSTANPDGIALPTAHSHGISITAQPNPFTTQTVLNFTGLQPNTSTTLQLYDVVGRLVATQSFAGSTATLPRHSLPKGMYFYTISQRGLQMGGGKLLAE